MLRSSLSCKISGGKLGNGSDQAPDVRLDIHACRFWEDQRSALSDTRVCHSNADLYRDLAPTGNHKNEKTCLYLRNFWTLKKELSHPLFSCKGNTGFEFNFVNSFKRSDLSLFLFLLDMALQETQMYQETNSKNWMSWQMSCLLTC